MACAKQLSAPNNFLDYHFSINYNQLFFTDLRIKSEPPLEVLIFEGLNVNKLVFMPESQFGYRSIQRIDPYGNGLMWGNAIDPDWNVIDGNFTIGVGAALEPKTKKIFGGFKRRRQFEFPEQTLLGSQRFLKSHIRNLFRC